MTVATQNDGRKWINAGVAIASMLTAYVVYSFVSQLGEWFELEARLPYFVYLGQAIAVAVGIALFFVVTRHPKTAPFLDEVYAEMLKVVWPDRQQTLRLTIGIIIGVTIIGFVFGLFDFLSSKLLGLFT